MTLSSPERFGKVGIADITPGSASTVWRLRWLTTGRGSVECFAVRRFLNLAIHRSLQQNYDRLVTPDPQIEPQWYDATPAGMEPMREYIASIRIPVVIYHYTRPEGFAGIFQSKAFWASHSLHLNDRGESSYAERLIEQAFDEFPGEYMDHDSEGFGYLQIAMKAYAVSVGTFRNDNYVTAFSSNGDQLSQWERYASPHGYAVGLGVAEALAGEAGPRLGLMPVEYSRPVQLRLIKEVLKIAFDALLTGSGGSYSPELLATWATNYGNLIQVMSRNFKDKAFSEEAEWRISTTLRNPRTTELEFRAGHFGVIPYTTIDFSDVAQVIVKRIVISPTNYFSEAKSAVELQLIASGIEPGGVEITPSKISLRI
jgi:hypothetical protein